MARAEIAAGRAFVSLYVKTSEFAHGLVNAENRLKVFAKAAGDAGAMLASFTPTGIIRNVSDALESMTKRFAAALDHVGDKLTSLGLKVTLFGAGVAAAFIKPINDASDLAETMSKFDVVFGPQAERVKAWGNTFASSVGRSKQEVAAFLAGAQDLFVPLGFAADKAEEMSKEVTKLAFDLGSFNNMADADTMRDLQAALTGSGEVMKKYGVIVNETAVKNRLLSEGIDAEKATDQQKVMARWQIILAGTTAAQGDAIRTASGWANTYKAVMGAVEDLSAAIGGALLPVLTPLLNDIKGIVVATTQWITANQSFVRLIAGIAVAAVSIGAAVAAMGASLSVLSPFVAMFGSLIGIIGSIASVVLPIITIFSLFGPQIIAIGTAAAGAIGSLVSVGGIMAVIGSVASAVLPVLLAIAGVVAGVAVAMAGLAAAAAAAAVMFWKLTDPIKNLWPVLVAVGKALGDITSNIMSGNWEAAAEAAIEGLRVVFLRGVQAIIDMVRTALERIPRFVNDVINGITGAASGMTTTIGRLLSKMWEAAKVAFNALRLFAVDVFEQLPGIAGYAMGRMFRAIIEGMVAINNYMLQVMGDTVIAIAKMFANPLQVGELLTGNTKILGRELGAAMSAGLLASSGLASGLMGGEAPEFKISDDTKAAIQQLADATGVSSGTPGSGSYVPGGGGSLHQPQSMAAQGPSFVSYSATAAMGFGAGTGSQDKILRELQEQKKLTKEQLEEQRANRAATEKLANGLRMGR